LKNREKIGKKLKKTILMVWDYLLVNTLCSVVLHPSAVSLNSSQTQ
jgi:hypothetical protein